MAAGREGPPAWQAGVSERVADGAKCPWAKESRRAGRRRTRPDEGRLAAEPGDGRPGWWRPHATGRSDPDPMGGIQPSRWLHPPGPCAFVELGSFEKTVVALNEDIDECNCDADDIENLLISGH